MTRGASHVYQHRIAANPMQLLLAPLQCNSGSPPGHPQCSSPQHGKAAAGQRKV